MSTAPINGLVGIRGFGRVSLVNLSGFGLISVIGSLVYHRGCNLLAAAASMVAKQAAAATKLTSPTKIASKAILYYFATSLLHMSLLWGRRCGGGLLLQKKRCGGGLSLLENPTTVMCYNMQNNYFLSGFRKWQNTVSCKWWLSIKSSAWNLRF